MGQDSRKAMVCMYKNIICGRNSIVHVYVGRQYSGYRENIIYNIRMDHAQCAHEYYNTQWLFNM